MIHRIIDSMMQKIEQTEQKEKVMAVAKWLARQAAVAASGVRNLTSSRILFAGSIEAWGGSGGDCGSGDVSDRTQNRKSSFYMQVKRGIGRSKTGTAVL